jgi:pyrroline-5-carboxylate reductase
MSREYELGLIGAGFMAEAIAAGALRSGLLQPDDLLASDPSEDRREVFSSGLGVAVTDDTRRVVQSCEVLLLAVKPQSLPAVIAQVGGSLRADQLLISILAGTPTAAIEDAFGVGTTRVVRVMPNLPMTLGVGMAAVCPGRHATAVDVDFSLRLFEAGGKAVRIDDEALMDAVTAVSGSGPAYFYYVVEALIEGGVRAGLPRPVADLLARQTCLGAARMLVEGATPPAELRAKVTSKGGTTAAAIAHLDRSEVREHLARAVLAAFDRGRELGQGG